MRIKKKVETNEIKQIKAAQMTEKINSRGREQNAVPLKYASKNYRAAPEFFVCDTC